MSHLSHIQNNKHILELRASIIKSIREFFWSQNFLEVETPTILRLPGQEPYLSPMNLTIHDETGKQYQAFLHTSPEYTLKKMLAAGFENIFSLCKTYRDYESFGGNHNPEFTMVEWYRAHADFFAIMDDVENLISYVQTELKKISAPICEIQHIERKHMKEIWKECININLDEYLTTESMRELCIQKGYSPKENERYEDLFFRIFLNEIEPTFADRGAFKGTLIIHHYPAQMAALARLSKEDPRYAERFEVYIHGIELANAFSELTDATEQKKRLEEEQKLRKTLQKDIFDIDEDFIEAVGNMPESSGIALGVDRLVQTLLGCQNINDVLVLPASKLFENT